MMIVLTRVHQKRNIRAILKQFPIVDELTQLEQKINDLREDASYASIMKKFQIYEATIAQLETSIAEKSQTLTSLRGQQAQHQESINNVRQKQQQLMSQQNTIQRAITELVRVHEAQLNWHSKSFHNFQQVIRHLKDSMGGILGTVPELCQLDRKYHLAVSAVLHPMALNTVVVESQHVALKVIDYFKKNKIGIVRCEITDSSYEQKSVPSYQTLNGCTPMSDVVTIDSRVHFVISKYISQWWVSETDDANDNIRKQSNPSGKRINVVSLTGSLYRQSGEVQFTPQQQVPNFFNCDSESLLVDRTDEERKEQEETLKMIRQQLTNLEKEEQDLMNELNHISRKVNQISR